MTEGKLSFTLDVEDRHDMLCHLKGPELAYLIGNVLQWLRDAMKHRELSEAEYNVLEELKAHIWEGINDDGLGDVIQ